MNLKTLLKIAFQEDAPHGDITSKYFGNNKKISKAILKAKANGVLAGIDIAKACFHYLDKNISFKPLKKDGDILQAGDILAKITGKTNTLLLAERTALNFLQHLSGIATQTNKFVKIIKKTKAKLLDTRKTIPGLRHLEKYAVRCGGGENHRLDLSSMVLIKDNHLANLTLPELAQKITLFRKKHKNIKIEIEASSLKQVKDFLHLDIDIIMLDNMSIPQIKKAIALRKMFKKEKIKFEVSGNVSTKNILKIAKTGVDYISVGKITHSAPALDISMLFY